MFPKLVGITGKKRSGKDTFAKVLTDSGWYRRVALADPLKADVAAFCGVTVEELEARKEAFRAVMQAYGTRRRKEDVNYWVHKVAFACGMAWAHGLAVVVPDIRYLNEAQWVASAGGVLVRVHRTGLSEDRSPEGRHSSEIEQDTIEVAYEYYASIPQGVQDNAIDFLRIYQKEE